MNLQPTRDLSGFTIRETAVINLVLAGYSNKEISRSLKITVGTVKIHLQNIYDKIGVRSRTKLIAVLYATNPE